MGTAAATEADTGRVSAVRKRISPVAVLDRGSEKPVALAVPACVPAPEKFAGPEL